MCGTRLLYETKTVEMRDVDEKEEGKRRTRGRTSFMEGRTAAITRARLKLWRQGKQQPFQAVTTETIVLTKKYPTDKTLNGTLVGWAICAHDLAMIFGRRNWNEASASAGSMDIFLYG